MKTTRGFLVTFFSCLFAMIVAQENGRKRLYTTKFDSLDVEAIIKNQRLLKSYIGCLLERNSCTADAAEMRKNLPDALATNCGNCSEAQKRFSDRLSHHLIDNRPEDWALLEKKYDPTGDYRRRYLKQQQQQQQDNVAKEEEEEEGVTETIASSTTKDE